MNIAHHNNVSSLSIRFDKSHLSSIGERLYSQSLDLIRELVANAYDADATRVDIKIDDRNMTVTDNGLGMNRSGLEQYFTIGSPLKKQYPTSVLYKRVRIGEFGIGKFAVLSLCDRFELFTSSRDYSATVIFDRADFEKQIDWSVPIIEHERKKDYGIRVTLFSLKKPLSLFDIERYLISIFPLSDNNFSIFLNDLKLQPKYIPGQRFHIKESTKQGVIKGEIILSSLSIPKELYGIGIRVRGVLIKRETFGMESSHDTGSRRLTGEVQADFLSITTDRNNIITDTAQYQEFFHIMQKKLKRVIKQIEKSAAHYQDSKAERMLSDVLLMIRESLKKNRDIFIMGDLPLFTKKATKKNEPHPGDTVIGTAIAQKKNHEPMTFEQPEKELKNIVKEAIKNLKPRFRGRIKTLLKDERRIVKKVKIGGAEFLVSFAHLGGEEKESFVEGGIIFINRDHKMYHTVSGKSDMLYYHLMRLISQELVKFAMPKNLEVAFDWQGKLIKDAYMGLKNIAS